MATSNGQISKALGVYIEPYNPMVRAHKEGYIAAWKAQRLAHHEQKQPPYKDNALASIVADNIYREAKVNLAIESSQDRVRVVGMSTMTRVGTARGSYSKLEDIVVLEDERRRHYGTRLLQNFLIDSWNSEASGITWDMSHDNVAAAGLYAKADPNFKIEFPHDLWSLTPAQMENCKNAPFKPAQLATPEDINLMDQYTLITQPRNIAYLARQLMQQERELRETHDRPESGNKFIVFKNGSFAIVSASYSSFQAHRRADADLYLARGYIASDVLGLMKKMSHEILTRHTWMGSPLQIRFADSMAGFTEEKVADEKKRIGPAMEALEEAYCVPLVHGNSRMIGCEIGGKDYVKAVKWAEQTSAYRPLTDTAQTRLHEAMERISLGLGNGMAAA